MDNGDVPIAAVADYRGAAPARRGGGGGFPGLRNRRRFRAAVNLAAWGAAAIMSTTVPSLSANPDHIFLCFVILMAGVLLLLLSMAAPDLPPWLEGVAARLEGLLGD